MATAKKRAKKKRPTAPAASRGLDARRLASAAPPTSIATLSRMIEDDGGSVLATYRDPLAGQWQLLAARPIDRVEPTPFQRDLSEAHVGKVASARRFASSKFKADQVARAGGPPVTEE